MQGFSAQRIQPHSQTTLNRLPPAKLSQPPGTSSPRPPPPARSPRPSLELRGPRSVHGERAEGCGAPSRRPQPHLQAPGASTETKAAGQAKDVSTLTEISYNADLPEVELVSLLTEELPKYTLRADCVFGYDHDDWLHTPILPPEVALGLSPELIEETLKYFLLCSERVGQVTKTYHDIEAVTHLLEEKERDLELAARIGQSLLKQNRELTERNELLDEQLEIAKEEIAQLRHELSMRDDLLHFYASSEELEMATGTHTPMTRNESSSSLSHLIQYDFLQQKLKGLEEENLKLRSEANDLTSETTNYEEKEQQLMMVCVEELSSVNKQVVDLSEELARKVEDSLRQQEEISSLLGQIVDLQQRCKAVTNENEELTQHLSASRESQTQLKSELQELQGKYSECEDMLREAREDIKNLRNKTLPNSTVQRYSALETVIPMHSLAAEIEGTFRRGIDSPAPSEYKTHPLRVFETVKVVNQVSRLRSRCQSPQVPGSSSASTHSSRTSTPRTSYYGSDGASLQLDDKAPPNSHTEEQSSPSSTLSRRLIGQPGTPGGHDLEAALRSLSARQQSHASERPFFEVERERKLRALAWQGAEAEAEAESSSGFLTPSSSTGTNYSGSSRQSAGSGLSTSSRSCLPDRLQIVKPLEGSVTLHHWQQLAKPNLGGILHPRPGVLTKDFRQLEVDLQHVYSLNDLEEDEDDSALARLASGQHSNMVPSPGPNLPQTSPTFTVTNCRILHHPSLLIPTLSNSLSAHGVCAGGSCQHVTSPLPSSALPRSLSSVSLPLSSGTPPLGLVSLLQKQGISALKYQPTGLGPKPSPSTTPLAGEVARNSVAAGADGRASVVDSGKRNNVFSFNLVEKLLNLGLHRVAARGMVDSGTEKRDWPLLDSLRAFVR